jgi:hypothetical protein
MEYAELSTSNNRSRASIDVPGIERAVVSVTKETGSECEGRSNVRREVGRHRKRQNSYVARKRSWRRAEQSSER